jgi:hypothetical protein
LRYLYDGETIFQRIPLFGGQAAWSNAIRGPWDAEDQPNFTRKC